MTIEEARSKFLSRINPISLSEKVPLLESLNRILSEDVFAPIDVPSFPKSAMDGYAVSSADVETASNLNPVQLKVLGENLAGNFNEFKYEKNSAVRVMTGGFVPFGFDSVIKQEDTDYGEKTVKIFSSAKPFMNYCKIGEDIQKGTLILKKNTVLKPVHIGILASLGLDFVNVRKNPKILIVSTGTELLNPGEKLQNGKIYNSISFLLGAEIKSCGMDFESKIVGDEEVLLKKILSSSENYDIIITTGGVSVGKKDIVSKILSELGAETVFRAVDVQPGTPTMGSFLSGKPILSLSGNPFAASVNFELYFWDILSKLTGNEILPCQKEAVFVGEYRKKNFHRRFIRAFYENGKVSLPSQNHASSVLSNLLECNCLIDLPPQTEIQNGQKVQIRFLKEI